MSRTIPFPLYVGFTLALLLGVSCFVTGSQSPPNDEPSTSDTGPPEATPAHVEVTSISGIPLEKDAKFGGVLVVATDANARGFNTWEEDAGISFLVTHPLLNMLVRPRTWGTEEDVQNNAFFEFHPDLAASWAQSGDGLRWTFALRDDVLWSDGVPFTCPDVRWSLHTIRDATKLRQNPWAVHLRPIRDVECLDPHTLVLTTNHPLASLLETIGMPQNVIRPKHVYENDLALMRDQPPTVTMGPFELVEWQRGDIYRFHRNPDYWDQPLPYLRGIELRPMERRAQVTALRAGAIDLGGGQGYAGPDADAIIQDCQVCRIWPRMLGTASFVLSFNHERDPWNVPQVREAVALAIDHQKYVDTLGGGWRALPTGCGLYPTSLWAMPTDRCARIPGYGDLSQTDLDADRELARRILRDAGYVQGQLRATVFSWQTTEADLLGIAEDLREIGLQADTLFLDPETGRDAWSEGSFDIGLRFLTEAGSAPEFTFYRHLYSNARENYGRYSNAEFDSRTDLMSRATNPDLRASRAWDALELALEDQAWVVLGHPVYLPVSHRRVRGFMPAPDYLALFGPQNRYDHVWLTEIR